ncbi:MAG: hypothetical protein CMN85_18960 [Spongiibacteraceae bacterium]|nr:hypothetical protein [Spongiibacteraceae bacterium]
MSGTVELYERLDRLRGLPPSQALAARLQLAGILLQRAETERDVVAQLLQQKVRAVLSAVEQISAAEPARPDVNKTQEPPPEKTTALSELLQEFRSQHREHNQPPLSELDKKMQEQRVRLIPGAEPARPAVVEPEELSGLKAATRLKHLQGRHAKRSKVQFALDNRPENPGPLNPHMLAVQILSQIQSTSPAYLEHLVTYMETLALLDQKSSAKGKKTTRAAKTS